MKTCFKCGKKKDLSEFYRHKQMADGHLGKCKQCTKADSTKHRDDNLEKVKAYDRARGMAPHRVALRAAYAQTEQGKQRLAAGAKAYYKRWPAKTKAKNMVNNAVRDGKLFKEPCSVCGSTDRIHGHHDDYAKPLNVRWLCSAHHKQWHRDNGEGANP